MLKKSLKQMLLAVVPLVMMSACATHAETDAGVPSEKPATFERLGVYVVSEDLERSRQFYEAVFEAAPEIQTNTFVGFDLAGGLFAIVSKDTFAPGSTLGGNVVPYIKVPDVRTAYQHIAEVAPGAVASTGVIDEGYLSLFKFTDPDGNVIEYFSVN